MLVPYHTSPHSLLQHATLMCRFAAPLSFNFMAAIALPYDKSVMGPATAKVLLSAAHPFLAAENFS